MNKSKASCYLMVAPVFFVVISSALALEQGPIPLRIRNWLTENPPQSQDLTGRVVVLEFWATSCPVCKQAITNMKDLAASYAPKGVLVVALSQDKSARDVTKFLNGQDINYHVAMDDGLGKRFSVAGIPTAFVINHIGQIIWSGHPANEAIKQAIEQAIQAAPPYFLDGIDLGPFESLRVQLDGGRDFGRAFRMLRAKVRAADPNDSQIASQIIDALEGKISAMKAQADTLRPTDPFSAYKIYELLSRNYRGAPETKEAIEVARELEQDPNVKNEIEAAGLFERAMRLMLRCRACSNCEHFQASCPACRERNARTIERISELLTRISEDYPGTKTAQATRRILEQIRPAHKATQQESIAAKVSSSGMERTK